MIDVKPTTEVRARMKEVLHTENSTYQNIFDSMDSDTLVELLHTFHRSGNYLAAIPLLTQLNSMLRNYVENEGL